MYNDASLRRVLNEISNQTDLVFIYDDNLISDKFVNLNEENINTKIVLTSVLEEHEISYKFFNKNSIVLFKQIEPISKLVVSPKGEKVEIVEYKGFPSVSNLKLVSNPTPEYPPSAIANEIEGEIVVKLMVSENGIVKNVIMEKSSGSEILDSETLRFVYNLEFKPYKINNVAKISWTRLSYNYVLIENDLVEN